MRLVQITDTHLSAEPDADLAGINCRRSLAAVLACIGRLNPAPDAILCTGDLSQDGSEAAYRSFQHLLSGFSQPQRWLPGNHDDWCAVRRVLGEDAEALCRTLRLGDWLILGLDSTVPEQVHGEISAEELDFLDQSLRETSARHVLVCLHHNPVPVAARWLQRHALRNPEDLFSVLDQYTTVRAVLWGHVHHAYEGERRGVRLFATPSTCVQFHPSADEFTLDPAPPGFRWLELHADGRIESGVERLQQPDFAVDFSSSGY